MRQRTLTPLQHVGKLEVNLLVEENAPLPSELRLQTLLRERNELLFRHSVEIGLTQAMLNNLNYFRISGPIHHALEVDGAPRPRLGVSKGTTPADRGR